MRIEGWLVALPLLLAPLAQVEAAEADTLRGVVQDPDGRPLEGAVVWLRGSGVATWTDARGAFEILAPGTDDVLVAAHEGHLDARLWLSVPVREDLNISLAPRRIPPWTATFQESATIALPIPSSYVPAGEPPVVVPFVVGEHPVGGEVTVTWPLAEVPLRVDVIHVESRARYGYHVAEGPIVLTLPPGMLRTFPGDYVVEIRPSEQLDPSASPIAVEVAIAVHYGDPTWKAVQGKPPEVADGTGEPPGVFSPHPSMDITAVRFTNETDHAFEVALDLASLGETAPQGATNQALWSVHWSYGDVQLFVGYATQAVDQPRVSDPERFIIGRCDAQLCKREKVIPGVAEPGSPGRLRWFVPKAEAALPVDGTALEGPFAVAFEPAMEAFFLPNELERANDRTAPGAPYAFGVHEFDVPPATVAAVEQARRDALAAAEREAQARNATTLGEPLEPNSVPLDQGPDGASGPWLVLALAAVGVIAVLAMLLGFVLSRRAAKPKKAPPKYERLRVLGEGANGRTFLARHRALGKMVAVKDMLPHTHADREARQRFIREARIGGALHHPNVVDVYDIEAGPGGLSLVMEYVEGGSLQELLDQRGALPLGQALRLWDEALSGLAAIHEAGVVHRDIKPSNILLTRQGTAKLADFGVAHSARERTLVTSAGAVVGTPMYMAPEQRRGQEPTTASDLYALTAVAYRMLSGRNHVEFDAILLAGASRPLPPPMLPLPGIPLAISDLLAQGLRDDPGQRPRDAEAFRAALRRAAGPAALPAPPPGPAAVRPAQAASPPLRPKGPPTVRVG